MKLTKRSVPISISGIAYTGYKDAAFKLNATENKIRGMVRDGLARKISHETYEKLPKTPKISGSTWNTVHKLMRVR